MADGEELLEAETSAETVGEAKWLALRELERRHPGVDRDRVTFEVLSEGERGLLGVGTAPARVVARVAADAVKEPAVLTPDRTDVASVVRTALERISDALGAECQAEVLEDDAAVKASLSGPGVGLLIGKRGRTIDALQYVIGAIAYRAQAEPRKPVVIDAAEYRGRREARLADLAARAAERARATGEPVALEPMTSVERKLVHTSLQDAPGVETRSEGDEPNRYVVIAPAGD